MKLKSAHIDFDDPEWDVAWKELTARNGDDPFCECDGEVWQYMGSELVGKQWSHCFRHRALQGVRTYLRIPASPDWQPANVYEFDTSDEPPF